jgi:hypothetical protein
MAETKLEKVSLMQNWTDDIHAHRTKLPRFYSPFRSKEVLVDNIRLGEPAHANVLVTVGGEDALAVLGHDVLRDDRDVTEEKVGIGVEARVCLELEALQRRLGLAGLEGVAERYVSMKL